MDASVQRWLPPLPDQKRVDGTRSQRRAWTPLPHAGEGRVVVPEARPYINPAGPVRLRITAAGLAEPLQLRQLDLGVRGRLA